MNDSGVPNPNGQGNLPVNNTNATSGIQPADLMTAIQNQLLGTSGAISSNNSKIDDVISSTMTNLQKSADASKGATTIAYDKQITTAKEQAAQTEQAYLNGQRGFATNMAALTDLRTNNAKAIQQIEDSKQQALLASDATTYSKLADLQIQKYTFEQQAQQQVFSNLVSLNNIALQTAQEKRLGQTQSFTESQAINNVALKYGIEVKPGDTYQDVVNRAKPKASAEEQAQLDQSSAQLALTQANTKLALANATKALTADKTATMSPDDFNVFIKSTVATDPKATPESLKAAILKLDITPAQRTQGYAAVDAYFTQQASSTQVPSFNGVSSPGTYDSGLLNTGVAVGNVFNNASQALTDFIFGSKSNPFSNR